MSVNAGVSVAGSLKFSKKALAIRCAPLKLSMRPSLPDCAISS